VCKNRHVAGRLLCLDRNNVQRADTGRGVRGEPGPPAADGL